MSMETEIPDELIELLELLQEGGLDEAGRARLHAMAKERPEFLPIVTSHFAVARALAQLEVPEQDQDFAGRTAAHVVKLANEKEFAFVGRVKRRIIVRRTVKVLAAAAVLALAILPFVWKRATPAAVQAEEVAVLSRLDKGGGTLRTETVRIGSRIKENAGLMRLNFTNGAVVAVEGPVDFTVVSAKEILLETGRLNAWCPEAAHGFKVRTASAGLTDLGTSFGVSATTDGRSEFVVLDGMVEVEKGSEKLRLEKGSAVSSSGKDALQSVAFEPTPFKKTWLLACGILSTSGQVAPVDPDVPEKVALAESDEFVMVIPEKRGVIFNRPLDAEIVEPGHMPGDFDGTAHAVSPVPEKRLRSVLLRFDPVGAWPDDYFLKLQGEVTFDRPVVAISCQRATLEKSDELFANRTWDAIYRGIELKQTNNPPDSVSLSPDRHTVSVLFYAGASTDEVRVFLEDN